MLATGARHAFHARRFRNRYVVAAGHPAPDEVRARLSDVVQSGMRGALAEALGELLVEGDESVWLIRRLAVEVTVDAEWDPRQLSRVWATRIAAALGAVLRDRAEGRVDERMEERDVLRFADQASYLQHFLVDLADGCAWSKWYYTAFAGLRALPTSAAIRTAVCDDPTLGRAALLAVPPLARGRVLAALGAGDARQVLARIAGGTAAAMENDCLEAVVAALLAARPQVVTVAEEPRLCLRLYLECCLAARALAGPTLRRVVVAAVRLARIVAAASEARVSALRRELGAGRVAEIGRWVDGDDDATLLPLLACDAERVAAVVSAVRQARRPDAAKDAAPDEGRATAFGGVFLLLPFLDALALDDATRDWPGVRGSSAAALCRLLVLAQCGGGKQAGRLLADPVMHEAAGVAGAPVAGELASWSAAIAPAQIDLLQRHLAHRQRVLGVAEGREVALARVRMPGGPVALLVDGARGHWLGAIACGRSTDRLMRRLRDILGDGAAEPLVDATEEASLRARLDLTHLAGQAAGRGRALRLALAVAAQGVMLAFAWRLPGFGRSSLAHLYHNFLDVPALVADEPQRRVVQLGRPPLGLILGMTGMSRATLRVSWLGARPLALFPEA